MQIVNRSGPGRSCCLCEHACMRSQEYQKAGSMFPAVMFASLHFHVLLNLAVLATNDDDRQQYFQMAQERAVRSVDRHKARVSPSQEREAAH